MTNEEFEEIYPRYREFTRAFARRLANADPDLADDYEQVGRIAVWEFDRSRVKTNEDSYIKRAIRNTLLNEHYAEQRAQVITPANTKRACKPGCQCARHSKGKRTPLEKKS